MIIGVAMGFIDAENLRQDDAHATKSNIDVAAKRHGCLTG